MNEKSFIDFPFSSTHQHLALVPICIRYLIPDSNADDTLWNESFTFFRFKFVIWKVLIWAQSLYRKFSFFFSGRNFDNSHFKRRKKVSIISKTSHPNVYSKFYHKIFKNVVNKSFERKNKFRSPVKSISSVSYFYINESEKSIIKLRKSKKYSKKQISIILKQKTIEER